jgi:hypothetical protein
MIAFLITALALLPCENFHIVAAPAEIDQGAGRREVRISFVDERSRELIDVHFALYHDREGLERVLLAKTTRESIGRVVVSVEGIAFVRLTDKWAVGTESTVALDAQEVTVYVRAPTALAQLDVTVKNYADGSVEDGGSILVYHSIAGARVGPAQLHAFRNGVARVEVARHAAGDVVLELARDWDNGARLAVLDPESIELAVKSGRVEFDGASDEPGRALQFVGANGAPCGDISVMLIRADGGRFRRIVAESGSLLVPSDVTSIVTPGPFGQHVEHLLGTEAVIVVTRGAEVFLDLAGLRDAASLVVSDGSRLKTLGVDGNGRVGPFVSVAAALSVEWATFAGVSAGREMVDLTNASPGDVVKLELIDLEPRVPVNLQLRSGGQAGSIGIALGLSARSDPIAYFLLGQDANLTPGRYLVMIRPVDANPRIFGTAIVEEAGPDDEPQVVEIAVPTRPVRGRLRNLPTERRVQGSLRVMPAVVAARVDNFKSWVTPLDPARIASDGTFTLPPLPPGSYSFQLEWGQDIAAIGVFEVQPGTNLEIGLSGYRLVVVE